MRAAAGSSDAAVAASSLNGQQQNTPISGGQWVLKLSEAWHSMSQHLGLRKLAELVQGSCSLSDEPAWLLGVWYGLSNQDDATSSLPPEVAQALLDDFRSRFWFTYRRDLLPIAGSHLTTDVGWGCTLRSGQMLMAEALARCWWGRGARFYAHAEQQQHQLGGTAAGAQCSSSSSAPEQASLLRLFVDEPGPAAPFSLHNLCTAGAPHGVVAGQWLGPWVLCKALAAAAEAARRQQQQQQQQQLHRPLGLQVHVVCDPGGGAPTLQLARLHALLQAPAAAAQQQEGLLLLVPLTLGVGKVNERYLPQLAALLSLPASVGIVGGRPGASLFFIGVQGRAVLFLDPHEVQTAPVLPADVESFHCTNPRVMQLSAIDPSLALGFFCSSAGELDELAARLQQLAQSAGGAPLMTVQTQDAPQPQMQPAAAAAAAADQGAADDWELV